MGKLTDIEGLGPAYAEKLAAVGVHSQRQLLACCAKATGRNELAKTSGLSKKRIMEWVNRADLARVKGIGEEFADLLECSGVDTVPELAKRRPDNLYARLWEVNHEKHLTKRTPSMNQVIAWVSEAKTMPRAIFY